MSTGRSFFDVWSVVHAAFWLAVGVFCFAVGNVSPWVGWPAIIVLAYVWEVAERNLFAYTVKHKEAWYNSFVSDPLMCFAAALGYALVGRPYAFAVGLLASWLVVGADVQAARLPVRYCAMIALQAVVATTLIRASFAPAPWPLVWVLEPLTVLGAPFGYWLISRQ